MKGDIQKYFLHTKRAVRVLIAILFSLSLIVPLLAVANQVALADDDATGPTLFLPVLMTAGASRPPVHGSEVYYIAPYGNDNNSGLAPNAAWATFGRAWQDLYPGDTLVLMDGVYYQSINPNKRNGQPGAPITIKAQNDGKAIIDGEGIRIPVELEGWPGPVGYYFVIEGIVARNSSGNVFEIPYDNNILRRVSGYDAFTDGNNFVFNLSGNNNLLEDCVAAGTGRKMILIFKGGNNTIRRCFADWQSWDGRQWCDAWPWGDNIQVYNSDNNIIENSIGYGSVPFWSISLQANSGSITANNNQVLGSMAIQAGMNHNGTVKQWPSTRPQPTSCTTMRDFGWGSQRAGFAIWPTGEMRNNLFQDIFAWGSAGLGFTTKTGGTFTGNAIRYATLVDNGLDNPTGPHPAQYGGINTDIRQVDLNQFSVSNSKIENVYIDWPTYPNGTRNVISMNGAGARLKYRYVNGVLTSQPLWPWPMEGRIQSELGFSVTNTIQPLLSTYGLLK